MRKVLVVIFLLISFPVFPQKKAEYNPGIWGVGNASCGNYLSSNNKNLYLSWFQGFVTGMNVMKNVAIGSNTDLEGAKVWFDKYCSENPIKSFGSAAAVLTTELQK